MTNEKQEGNIPNPRDQIQWVEYQHYILKKAKFLNFPGAKLQTKSLRLFWQTYFFQKEMKGYLEWTIKW